MTRRIIAALSDIRALQLNKIGASPQRLAESRDMFSFMDRELSGISDPRSQMTVRLGEVMTSADFTYAIMDFVQRQMKPAYEEKRFEFEPLVDMDTSPNFLPVQRYQQKGGLDDLEYVGEKGSAREGYIPDADKKEWQVYVWEKVYDFSMRAIINDDIGYFRGFSEQAARSARRTLEKYVSRLYTNATSIARLTGLGALYSTNGRLTAARISTARMAFNQRVDAIRGNPLPLQLKYLVYHAGLVDTVRTIRQSQLVPELATNAANVIAGDFVPIEDPYIVGTAPNLPWWAFTDHRGTVSPLILGRRQGMPGPMLIRKSTDMETFGTFIQSGRKLSPLMGDFATGNVQIKIHDEWGTYIDGTEGNLFDYQGAYYSSGTAA